MKISPRLLKIIALTLIIASAILWPLSAATVAKGEPQVVLGLSWLALIIAGFAFYSSAQDGEDIDHIYDLLARMAHKLGIEEEE